jgi:hypothetical protein
MGDTNTATHTDGRDLCSTPLRWTPVPRYVEVLIGLWLFLFAAQPKEFILDGLKKLEQLSHKCEELRRNI